MSLQERIKEAYKNLKAPEGQFIVCEWDPSNPEKSIPCITRTETTKRKAVYKSEIYASWYAGMRNKKWFESTQERRRKGKTVIGEADYFVVDDQGIRR